MIRINLLPAGDGRRRTQESKGFALILVAILLAEVVGLFVWYQAAEDELRSASVRASAAEKDLRELQRRKKELEAREQAILFLNRRGFAPTVLCEACGKGVECPNCSVSLTLHRRRGEHLRCHYCDFSMPRPAACPQCKSDRLSDEGAGTERIESALAEAFPEARIARLDRDVAAGLKSEQVLDRMRRRDLDILVGTQMVTKGHDLPGVTLVGVAIFVAN